jgi:hypothetical protein
VGRAHARELSSAQTRVLLGSDQKGRDDMWGPPVSSTKEGEGELGQPMDNGLTACDCSWDELTFGMRKGR